MLVAWLWLATVSGAYLRLSPRVVLALFVPGLSPVSVAPIIYLAFDVSFGHHLFWFIQLMKYGGALAAVPIGPTVTTCSENLPVPNRALNRLRVWG
ncbi:MAG: hypothetical protein IIC09_06570 [Proteobacteria bacterium]|nr:hypothetical protein [Pseudomonadota bacterium]